MSKSPPQFCMPSRIETSSRAPVFVIGTLIVLASACAPQITERKYKSADGIFAVRLIGTFVGIHNPLARARVQVVIDKYDRTYAELGDIYSADSFDVSFDQLYTHQFWSDPRVFRMTGVPREELRDAISVTNASGISVKAIAVATADTVVLVEIPPDSTVNIPVVSMSGGSSVFVRVTAQLADGRRLQESIDLPPAMSSGQCNAIAITVRDRLYIGLSIKDRSTERFVCCCGLSNQ
jgi:hypothetical protein